MAVTKDEIWAKADELDAAGQSPTLAAIRKALGSGSYSTIQAAMSEWRARRNKLPAAPTEPAPQALSEAAQRMASEIWGAAIAQARTEFQQERAALLAEKAQAEAAYREAVDLSDAMEADMTNLKSKLAGLADVIDSLKQSLAAAEDERKRLIVALEAANAKLAEHEKSRETVATMQAKIESLESVIAKLARLSPEGDE